MSWGPAPLGVSGRLGNRHRPGRAGPRLLDAPWAAASREERAKPCCRDSPQGIARRPVWPYCGGPGHGGTEMRIAVVSDIHGNRTAFEAVLADLRETSPDLVLHGGDLSDGGSEPAEVVDQIRDLGWPGVVGNTDEMLAIPQAFEEFAATRPQLNSIWVAVREMAAATREELGEERLAWLRGLPRQQVHGPMTLVHASPESPWRSPAQQATDDELETVYRPLGTSVA